MIIRPDQVDPKLVYSTMIRAIHPRPIAWVSSISKSGISNLAPFSYFNGVCSRPAALSFSVVNKQDGRPKDTVLNIESNGEFVVNVVPYSLAGPMLKTADEIDFEESEFEAAGLTECDSKTLSVPGVKESPVRFECVLNQIVRIGDGPLAANLIIGEVQLIEIADDVLDESQKLAPERLDLIGRLGGVEYCRTTERFRIPK
ncbi:MAG: flavin reductase family protein [Planctomycetota bacterium]